MESYFAIREDTLLVLSFIAITFLFFPLLSYLRQLFLPTINVDLLETQLNQLKNQIKSLQQTSQQKTNEDPLNNQSKPSLMSEDKLGSVEKEIEKIKALLGNHPSHGDEGIHHSLSSEKVEAFERELSQMKHQLSNTMEKGLQNGENENNKNLIDRITNMESVLEQLVTNVSKMQHEHSCTLESLQQSIEKIEKEQSVTLESLRFLLDRAKTTEFINKKDTSSVPQEVIAAPYDMENIVESSQDNVGSIQDAGQEVSSLFVMDDDIENYYKLGHILNSGGFSDVIFGTQIDTGTSVAIKVVDKTNADNALMIKEVKMLARLDHIHVIKLIEAFECVDAYFIVMELANGGDLFDYIVSIENEYSEMKARNVMLDVFRAVEYLHCNSIVHCDIKPENFVFAVQDGKKIMKLIDFGFSKECKTDDSLTEFCGTVPYIAPEILDLNRSYGKPADMWSLGVLFYVLLSGRFPWQEKDDEKLRELCKKGEWNYNGTIWDSISNNAKNLVESLLMKSPHDRLTVSECFNHSWMVEEDDEAEINNLLDTIKSMKNIIAKRKMKAATNAVIASNKLKRLLVKKENN